MENLILNETLFLSTTCAPDGMFITKVLDICAKYGIQRVELGSNHAFIPDPVSAVGTYGCGSLVHNYFPAPEIPFVVNIASADKAIRDRSLAHVEACLSFCAKIGARLYTFHPGFVTDPRGASMESANYDFLFSDGPVSDDAYRNAYALMLESTRHIVGLAAQYGIRIAIETEGSIAKSHHLLMQRPSEFETFFASFEPAEIGINLNIGHLRLASEKYKFDRGAFVNLVQGYIVAMELSHNDGVEDDHLPLQDGEWYWGLIADSRFRNIPKVLELRNTPIESAAENLLLCQRHLEARQ